ncbi:alpha/beta fold hydrolase [Cytobacillus sp. NCCP-133]|uniref:alpha/beta fold hydrolase n=1 Tax=Cytobacillus sp. NCCP-133 TaxID=766848 RepID=UPI0022309DE5|nr:alpha/beta hydrolase [Cytobacillus sp. NCCP-133]GLB59434.1 AB hydrolase superfamily protein YvaM [Cytobacillus sp. NCCP-133]
MERTIDVPAFLHGDTKIFYDIKGDGVPIIFIHPPAMGRKVFYYQKELSKHFHVIFPDLSGNGDTSGPEKEVSIRGYANEIKALMDHLQIEKAVVLGYSSGGIVAQEFALSYPERTLSVILSGGFPEVLSETFRYEHILGMYFVKHFPGFLRYVIATSHTNDKQVRNLILSHMKKANHTMWFQFYERSLHYSCTDRLGGLDMPLLLIYGSRDFVNQHIRSYSRYVNFQSAIIKGVSHQVPTKKWQLFNQVITGFVQQQCN